MTALGLGTAQLAFDYGVSNRGGKPSEAEAEAILGCALERGVHTIDTAAAYDEVEALIGRSVPPGAGVQIITKTAPLGDVEEVTTVDCDTIERAAERSRERLRRDRLDCLLLHHGSELALPGGERLARCLVGLREGGVARRLGVSVYTRGELDLALELLPLDIVQLPLNVFDQRLLRDGTLDTLRESGIEVHARSVFLQGLLLMVPEELPAGLAGAEEPLRRYRRALSQAGLSPLEAALQFVRAEAGVGVALVGINSVAELEECVAALGRESPPHMDYGSVAVEDPYLIDPRRWTP